MTNKTQVLVFVSGILALIPTASVIALLRSTPKPVTSPAGNQLTAAISALVSIRSRRLIGVYTTYAPFFFGVLSLAQSKELATTPLGSSVCLGIAIYFTLEGVAYALAPPGGTKSGVNFKPVAYVSMVTAACYGTAALSRYVI